LAVRSASLSSKLACSAEDFLSDLCDGFKAGDTTHTHGLDGFEVESTTLTGRTSRKGW
jgi:hypothetical protein